MADRYIKGQSVFKGFSSRADNSNFKLYDFALIKQDLINRLSVRKGERVENPEFGKVQIVERGEWRPLRALPLP